MAIQGKCGQRPPPFPSHKGLVLGWRSHEEGSVLENVVIPRGLGGVLDLGWVKLVEPKVPEDWVWGIDSYLKEWDLPQFEGLALDGKALWLQTYKTKKWYLVVSENAWENRWKEVEELLLSTDIAR